MRICEGRRPRARATWCALLIALAFAVPSTAVAASLTRGPYLQLRTRQSVTVVWNTDVPAACALAVRPLDGLATLRTGSTGTVCAITVDGLLPGTAYAYTPFRRRPISSSTRAT